jgi:flagella basal body P-ring formation protein FlgA
MKLFPILILTLVCGALPVHAIVLELRAQQTLAAATVSLNDIISSSQGVSSDDLGTAIAESPSLGKAQTWTRADIEKVLPATLRQVPIEWSGAPQITVSRPAVEYSPREARMLISGEIARHLPTDADFAILEMPGTDAFLIPQGPLQVQVELGDGSLRNEWGDATLKFSAQGHLAVTKSIRVAAKDPLAAGAFTQVDVNVLKLPGALQPATDFPEGKVAAHQLTVGKILMENDWIEPVLVNRNDLVTVSYDHHGISITVQAKAMSTGTRNQVIAVQNVTSHKIFNARIVDERSLVYDQ